LNDSKRLRIKVILRPEYPERKAGTLSALEELTIQGLSLAQQSMDSRWALAVERNNESINAQDCLSRVRTGQEFAGSR
jgi:hypothetical protein